jgi:hypothetical protein
MSSIWLTLVLALTGRRSVRLYKICIFNKNVIYYICKKEKKGNNIYEYDSTRTVRPHSQD